MFLNEFAAQANMKPARLVVALALLFSLFGLQVWQTLERRDDWPLSSFPMYSGVQGRTATSQSLVAVTERGEVPLDAEYTRPISGRRLQQLLGSRGSAFTRELANNVCGNLKRLGKPGDFSAIRFYRASWNVRADLKGIGGKRQLVTTIPVLCPEQKRALESERDGTSAPAPMLAAADGDIVLDFAQASLEGGAKVVADGYANLGQAVLFEGAAEVGKASVHPTATFLFNAPAGSYWLWLRGKSLLGRDNDSVSIQFNDEIGNAETSEPAEFGNFRDVFPPGAYTWSSRAPMERPEQIELTSSGAQRLRVTLYQGPLTLDQLVLTRNWPERPLHNRPLRTVKGPQ